MRSWAKTQCGSDIKSESSTWSADSKQTSHFPFFTVPHPDSKNCSQCEIPSSIRLAQGMAIQGPRVRTFTCCDIHNHQLQSGPLHRSGSEGIHHHLLGRATSLLPTGLQMKSEISYCYCCDGVRLCLNGTATANGRTVRPQEDTWVNMSKHSYVQCWTCQVRNTLKI
jgi:hypothetical protein